MKDAEVQQDQTEGTNQGEDEIAQVFHNLQGDHPSQRWEQSCGYNQCQTGEKQRRPVWCSVQFQSARTQTTFCHHGLARLAPHRSSGSFSHPQDTKDSAPL